ncbi:MAG: NAD+ kinase [Desulfuromonas sp.]|nr:MAG: NAD+ kinase [Desulfuromonas sp.]
MAMGVGGGLALFLYGMDQLTVGMKAVAGTNLQAVLARLTGNRFSGAFVGAAVTAVIQSSSVTTVLVVGFVSAGLMSLSQAIGVIMGANVGTTITAQVIAFKVTGYALLFVALGFAFSFLGRSDMVRNRGKVIFGLGLVFFGMSIMSDVLVPLRSYEPFLDLMVRMEYPLLGIAVGALFTALIQSSSATSGIVVVLASQGFITLPAGIALALGANVGTCVTAVLAALGKSRSAMRAAAVHVVFNLAGVLIWLAFIDQLAALSVSISPAAPELSGMARVAAETPRQIANANTLFNVANTLIFIAFTPQLAQLVTRLIPDLPLAAGDPVFKPRFLDEQLLDTPAAALNLVRMELGQLGYHVLLMLQMFSTALEKRSLELLRELEKADDMADVLQIAIIEYLSKIGKRQLTEIQAQDYYRFIQSADTLEAIGDILEADMSALGLKMIRGDKQPSPTASELLAALHHQVARALEFAVKAVVENDQQAAQEVLALRQGINVAVEESFHQQVRSLAAHDLNRRELLQLEFEMTDKLRQIYSLCKRIARLYVPREV